MEIDQILHEFAHSKTLPVEAIRAAEERREEIVPVFLDILRRCVEGDPEMRQDPSPVFFTVMMLGQFREKAAFPLLLRLLRIDRDDLYALLGDALVETMPKVIAATFDGNLRLLYDVIEDAGGDDMMRWQLLEVLAMLVRQGDADRDEIARYLRQCYTTLQPQEENEVWVGWQAAIALLGLKELSGLVEEAFERPLVPPEFLNYADFLEDLEAAQDPETAAKLFEREHVVPFDDTVKELEHWYSFSEPSAGTGTSDEDEVFLSDHGDRDEPVVNPFRHVGRNDPCPCGSGKKFKKCCLAKVEAGGSPG